MTTSANAQVFVNPAMPDQWLTSVTTTNAGVPVSSPDDVTINCDMLNDGKGNAIKAIAWDEGSRSQQGYLYFEDGKGNTTTYKVKGVHPDIVLGDDRDRLGVDYRVAVTYIDPGGYPMLAFYKLIMLGTPSFTVVPLNVIQLSTNAA
ncbi:MAG: hypothetical protein JSS78_02030, partial [Bacteroidetes bacterium]|nr:hypothetical protein [Bacteroidota bacterium]